MQSVSYDVKDEDGELDYVEWSCELDLLDDSKMDQIQAIQGKSQFQRLSSLNNGFEAIPAKLLCKFIPLLTQDILDWASTSEGEFSYKLIKLKCLDGDLSLKLTVRYGDEHLWMIMINMIR